MRSLLMLGIGLAVLGCSGCAGYRVGPTNGSVAGARSIQVNLFQNQTPEPRLIEAVGTALRRSLQQDGTYRLTSSGAGDIVVSGVITRFERSPLSFQPKDILTFRDFTISMAAKITAIERNTGIIVVDREVVGHTTVRASADLASAERQAVPLLAEDLAQNVTTLLVDGKW